MMSAISVQPRRFAETADSAEAAGGLFAEHSERVLGYCMRQLGSRSEAEDATQETFLLALRALRRGVVPECESAWLTTIAKNVCHSERRTVDRRGPLAQGVDLDAIALAQTGDDEEELLMGFREALASMPQKQRRALVLREWQGVPSREIASELGMSATATHALLTRARHSFAQALTLPGRPVAGVVWLVFELRSHLKALLGGVSAKAAATSVAVIAVGVGAGGIAVDRSMADSKGPPAPARSTDRPAVEPNLSVSRARATSPPRAPSRGRATGSRASARGPVSTAVALRPSTVSTARPALAGHPETTPEPVADGLPPATPAPELPANLPVKLPVDKPQLPEIQLPTQLVPPVEVPPLPAVELPPAPPLPLPSEAPPLPAVPLP